MGSWFSRSKTEPKEAAQPGRRKDDEFEAMADEYLKKQSLQTYCEKYGDVSPDEPDGTIAPAETPHTPLADGDDGYYSAAEKSMYECQHIPVTEDDTKDLAVRWQRGGLIGSGGFGKVFLGLNLDTGELLAVKQITLKNTNEECQAELESIKQEVCVMKSVHHENIVQYKGMSLDSNTLNIFMEYIPSGSISSLLRKFGRFSEGVLKVYTRQILLGLQYMHNHHILHRDVKGANILADNTGVVKLTDFGAAKRLEGLVSAADGFHSLKGTPHWMAPEVIRQCGHGRQADVWSLGCTVIEMATGKPPWSEIRDQISVLYHIAESKEMPPLPDDLSPEALDFLSLCLTRMQQAPLSLNNIGKIEENSAVDPWCQHRRTGSDYSNCSNGSHGSVSKSKVKRKNSFSTRAKISPFDEDISPRAAAGVPVHVLESSLQIKDIEDSGVSLSLKEGGGLSEREKERDKRVYTRADKETIQNYLRQSTIKETGRLMTPEQKSRVLQGSGSDSDSPHSNWVARKRKDWEFALENELMAEAREDGTGDSW